MLPHLHQESVKTVSQDAVQCHGSMRTMPPSSVIAEASTMTTSSFLFGLSLV